MDVFYAYTYGSGIWLFFQAMPLIISPTFMKTLLSAEVGQSTALESYFSRSLGISLLTLAILVILLTGSVPLTSSISDTRIAGVTDEGSDSNAPYAVPTLMISMVYHSAMSFYCYTRYNYTRQLAFGLGFLGSTGLAAIGLWCLLFASQSGRISRKTGADKRTSNFPFGNSQSARSKKKQLGKAI